VQNGGENVKNGGEKKMHHYSTCNRESWGNLGGIWSSSANKGIDVFNLQPVRELSVLSIEDAATLSNSGYF
jgi:hypothetical protein